MDDRKRRLGQHAADNILAWVVKALGPSPEASAAQQDWERKAASIAAYREMYGYQHPEDPLGPQNLTALSKRSRY